MIDDPHQLDALYRPPQATPPRQPAASGKPALADFKRVTTAGRAACGLVAARVLLDFGYGLFLALGGERGRLATLFHHTTMELDSLWALVTVAAWSSYLVWVHRVHHNLRLFTARETVTGASALIAYFAPFANLWLPQRNMRVAWKISEPGRHEPQAALPVMVWWGFICAEVAVFLVSRVWLSANPPPSWEQTLQLSIAARALSVASGVACVWMVMAMVERQNETAARFVAVRRLDEHSEPGLGSTDESQS